MRSRNARCAALYIRPRVRACRHGRAEYWNTPVLHSTTFRVLRMISFGCHGWGGGGCAGRDVEGGKSHTSIGSFAGCCKASFLGFLPGFGLAGMTQSLDAVGAWVSGRDEGGDVGESAYLGPIGWRKRQQRTVECRSP